MRVSWCGRGLLCCARQSFTAQNALVCVCVDGHRGGGVKLHCLLVFYLETDSELEVEAVLTEIISVVDFQAHYYKLTVCI